MWWYLRNCAMYCHSYYRQLIVILNLQFRWPCVTFKVIPARTLRCSNMSSINTNGCYKSLLLTLFFCFWTVNLELFTSTYSLYRQTLNVQASTKVTFLPVCFYCLVTLRQRLWFVTTILALYKFVCMYMCMYSPTASLFQCDVSYGFQQLTRFKLTAHSAVCMHFAVTELLVLLINNCKIFTCHVVGILVNVLLMRCMLSFACLSICKCCIMLRLCFLF